MLAGALRLLQRLPLVPEAPLLRLSLLAALPLLLPFQPTLMLMLMLMPLNPALAAR
jgi:hypothetical protein